MPCNTFEIESTLRGTPNIRGMVCSDSEEVEEIDSDFFEHLVHGDDHAALAYLVEMERRSLAMHGPTGDPWYDEMVAAEERYLWQEIQS